MLDAVVRYVGEHDSSRLDETMELFIGRAFVVARGVTDRSVGIAMDYGQYQAESSSGARRVAVGMASEILAPGWSIDNCSAETASSLRVAVVSAMCRPFFSRESLESAGLRSVSMSYSEMYDIRPGHEHPIVDCVADALSDNATAAVVGFGNNLEVLAFDPRIKSVVVADRHFASRRITIDRVVASLNRSIGYEKVKFVGSDSSQLNDVDVIDITASSLCNSSIEELLRIDASVRILTGPSGAVAPAPLVDAGIDLIVTELRRPDFPEIYIENEHLVRFFDEYDTRLCIMSLSA